jgi:hypothetical protein
MAVRGGDLVMFPHASWPQLSGTPQRQPGMRLGTTGDGPVTTPGFRPPAHTLPGQVSPE